MILQLRDGSTVEHRTAGEWGTKHIIPMWSAQSTVNGLPVSSEDAVGLSTAAQAIRTPASLIAGLPLDVYDVSQDRKTRTLSRGKWQNQLLDQPDPFRPGFDFWSDLSSHVDGYGNAIALKLRNPAGRVEALMLLEPERVHLEVDERTRERTYCYRREDGSRLEIPGSNILHVRGWDPCGEPWACSPIDRHRAAIGKTLARSRFEERFLQNDARPGIVIKMPQNVARHQAEEWLEVWDARHRGPSNQGKTALLGGGADLATIPVSLKDSQFIEGEQFTVGEMARIFDWPEELLGGNSARPFVEVMGRMVRLHLMPRIARIESALGDDPDLFGARSKFRPFFDVSDLLRGDAAVMASVFHQLIQVGAITPNEARVPLGWPPLEGGDDLQKTPVGGAPNGQPAEPPEPPEPAGPPEQADDTAETTDTAAD